MCRRYSCKVVFDTAFELDPRDLIYIAIDRSPFIDQSLGLFVAQRMPPLLVSSSSPFLSHHHRLTS